MGKGGRVVDCTGLENRQRRESLVGSNPTPSARINKAPKGPYLFWRNGCAHEPAGSTKTHRVLGRPKGGPERREGCPDRSVASRTQTHPQSVASCVERTNRSFAYSGETGVRTNPPVRPKRSAFSDARRAVPSAALTRAVSSRCCVDRYKRLCRHSPLCVGPAIGRFVDPHALQL